MPEPDEKPNQHLVHFIQNITAAVKDGFGSFGTGMSFAAVSSGAQQVGRDLHASTLQFAAAYQNPKVKTTELRIIMERIESLLMAGQTLGAITEARADELTDELYKVAETRENL